jgi:putative transposase
MFLVLNYPFAMPRIARVVIPGLPHHVTQRGNRRLPTFFCDGDYQVYRSLMAESCRAANVEVLAYCLMPNHVHLVLVPSEADGLRCAIAESHRRYAASINRRHGWRGHLWQERFHSCPLQEDHLLAAVRYVELNPVRAQLVKAAQDWRWSSAPAHLSGQADELVSATLPTALAAAGPWREFLSAGVSDAVAERLRRHLRNGRPFGGEDFVAELEARTARLLRPKRAGRPSSAEGDSIPISPVDRSG